MSQFLFARRFPAALLLGTVVAVLAATCAASAATPRVSAATPDISGPWQFEGDALHLRTSTGAAPPLLPAMQQIYARHTAEHQAGDRSFDPMARCLPPGVPRLLMQPMPFNVVQGKHMYGFMFQWNHLHRVVYLDEGHFEPIGPLYLGQSIGHWDGDTLVVDTTDYNDTTLLDDAGMPHTALLHTVERLRLRDGGQVLEDRIHFEDSGAFSRPWDAVLRFRKRPGVIITEDYCLGRTGHGTLRQQ